ncbi:hypothetical protein PHYPSEUDO_011471 [Phytophthora pseudosyringae]|uniref:RxLR effector protein n=1 Tax=Phytophthora pseudosyringae TaxID=221518 RepID=A0A8T1W8G2_9STRA|nr:hypothetical protein PHYPSEUDO_011471 [Phytophthora pseudosyringae]
MTPKAYRTKYRYCVVLLTTAITLLTCVTVASTAADSKTTINHNSRRLLLAGMNDGRFERRLRTTVTTESYNDEERTIIGISTLKDLTQAGTKTLEKLAEAAKNTLTSNNQATTNNLFKQFKLEEGGSHLLASTQFDDWVAAVTKAYKTNPKAGDAAMVTTLATHYSDEALASMLAAAKQVASTKSTATRLEDAHLNTWKADGKTADDVFKLLKLDEAGGDLLKSSKLSTWVAYSTKLKNKPYDDLLLKLKPSYDDAALAKMIALAKKDATTTAVAENLESAQVWQWVKQDKSVIDVFRLLKLNEEGATLLKSPMLGTWVKYVDMQNKDPYNLLFSAMKKTKVDEVALARMIGAAKKDVSSASIAEKLEQLQIAKWSKAEKSGDDLFLLLGLKKEKDKVFESPVWDTWVSYLVKKEDDADTVMFSVLRTNFGNNALTQMVARSKEVASTKDVAAKLELDIWRMNGQTSDDIFTLLKLDKVGDKVLESPALSTWVAYVRKLSSFKKNPDELMAITQLEERFGTVKMARMLVESKEGAKTAATKKFIEKLQAQQFKRWVYEERNPKEVAKLLAKSSDSISATVKSDFEAFYKTNKV